MLVTLAAAAAAAAADDDDGGDVRFCKSSHCWSLCLGRRTQLLQCRAQ